jgi:hypothetical protein
MCFKASQSHTVGAERDCQLIPWPTPCCCPPPLGVCNTGGRLQEVFTSIPQWLHTLHLGNPAPITNPRPALKVTAPASTNSHIRNRRTARQSSQGTHARSPDQQQSLHAAPPQYQEGSIWVPDTYSLGPAPMLLAGAECMQACMSWTPQVGSAFISHDYLHACQPMHAVTKAKLLSCHPLASTAHALCCTLWGYCLVSC